MTTNRRSFLASSAGALSGLMFCGCGLHARKAHAQGTPAAPAVRRTRARVKVIDTHAHCYFQEALDLLGPQQARAVLPPVRGQQKHFIPSQLESRLKMMDGGGVDRPAQCVRHVCGTSGGTRDRRRARTAQHLPRHPGPRRGCKTNALQDDGPLDRGSSPQ
jgi:hypothetical protein